MHFLCIAVYKCYALKIAKDHKNQIDQGDATEVI